MKKFILTITAYILILATLVVGINALYIAREPYDNLNVNRFQSMPETIQICNFGSSHGHDAFCYDQYPELGTFNFAFAAQSLSYDYRLLYHYQDRLAEGSLVFIPISFFSLFGIPETEQDDFIAKNRRYYHVLPGNLIKDFDFVTYLYTVPFPAVGAGTNVFSVLLKGGQKNSHTEETRTAESADLTSNVSGTYWRHLVQNKLDEQGNRILQEEEMQALYDIIALCKSRNATPILVTTPFLKEYTDMVQKENPEFLPYFHSIIQQICDETDVAYLDYSLDPRFMNDYSLFYNCDHMNTRGARLFTSTLLEDVKNLH